AVATEETHDLDRTGVVLGCAVGALRDPGKCAFAFVAVVGRAVLELAPDLDLPCCLLPRDRDVVRRRASRKRQVPVPALIGSREEWAVWIAAGGEPDSVRGVDLVRLWQGSPGVDPPHDFVCARRRVVGEVLNVRTVDVEELDAAEDRWVRLRAAPA